MTREYVDHLYTTEDRGDPVVATELIIIKFDEWTDPNGKDNHIYKIGFEKPPIDETTPLEEQLVWIQDTIDNYTHPVTPLLEIVPDFTDELRSQIEKIDFSTATDIATLKTKLKEFKEALLGKRTGDTARIARQEKI